MTFTIPRPAWVSDDLVAERGEHAGFQMFTREGNDAVAEMLTGILTGVLAMPTRDHLDGMRREQAIGAVRIGVAKVARTHPEVHDTEPEWAITDAVNACFEVVGFAKVDREDLF